MCYQLFVGPVNWFVSQTILEECLLQVLQMDFICHYVSKTGDKPWNVGALSTLPPAEKTVPGGSPSL